MPAFRVATPLLLLLLLLVPLGALQSPLQSLATVTFSRSGAQNQLWNEDAFPLTPLPPYGSVALLNVSGPGVLTHLHAVLVDLQGPDPAREVNVAVFLRVTYDGDPGLTFTVPYGAFFQDSWGGQSALFESALFAKRQSNALHSVAPMPFAKSILVELVSAYARTVGGYALAQYERLPSWSNQGYFFAQFTEQHLPQWPYAAVQVVEPISGAGHVVGVSYTATTNRSDIMNEENHFVGVCEGNWNFFIDNTTALPGNSSSPLLLSWLGSEDFFGQSFGWTAGTNLRSGTTYIADHPTRLATYRMLVDAPIRFNASLTAAIQWDWDHPRIPRACLGSSGACPVNFTVTTYYYLAVAG